MDDITKALYLLLLREGLAATAICSAPHIRAQILKTATGSYWVDEWDKKLIRFIKQYNSILRRANNDATEVENRRCG